MEQLQTDLENATQGLHFISETDAPFAPVDLGKQDKAVFTPGHLLQMLQKPADTPLEVQEVPYFLRNMTKAREGDSPEKLEDVQRFQKLQDLLLERLIDVKAYRIGEIQVEVYLLGWTPEHHLAGLKTLSVET